MRRGGSILQHDDDDDEDLSFEEDSQESPWGGRSGFSGGNYGGYGRTTGALSGFGGRGSGGPNRGASGGYGGSSAGGGGGDAYSFDIDMSKNAPFAGFDDEEFLPRRTGGGPSTGMSGTGFGRLSSSSLTTVNRTTPTAKAKAGSLARGGSMAETNRQFDLSRFEQKSTVPSRAPAAAAPTAASKKHESDDSEADFEKFLNESDNSDRPAARRSTPADKPKSAPAAQDPVPKASTLRDTRSTPNVQSSSKLAPSQRSELSEDSIRDGSSEEPPPPEVRKTVPEVAQRAPAAGGSQPSASRSASEGTASRSESPRAYGQRSLPQSANSASGSRHSRPSSPRSASSAGSGKGIFGKVMNAADFFAASPAPVAKASVSEGQAKRPPEVPSETASVENSQSEELPQKVVVAKKQLSVAASASSPCASRQASYGDDFHGESPAMMRAAATYDEDFEEDSASRPDDRPAPTATNTAPAALQPARSAVVARPKQAAGVPTSGVNTRIPSAGVGLERRVEDDDYRPRRPTEHVGVQAEFGVDVGVQCDPPAPEHHPAPSDPMGMWSHASQPWFAAYGQPLPNAPGYPGMPSQFAGNFAGGSMHGHPAMAGMPFMNPYTAGLMPPGVGSPAPFANPAVLRQLFALGSLKPGFGREAWTGTGVTAESKPVPASPSASLHPDLAAMSAIDESFRQQLELLKAAAGRHRTLLEQTKPQLGGAAPGTGTFLADSDAQSTVARPARVVEGAVGPG